MAAGATEQRRFHVNAPRSRRTPAALTDARQRDVSTPAVAIIAAPARRPALLTSSTRPAARAAGQRQIAVFPGYLPLCAWSSRIFLLKKRANQNDIPITKAITNKLNRP